MSGHTGNKGSVPEGMQRAKIQCANGCITTTSYRVIDWPIGQKQPKIYCRSCQRRGGERAPMNGREELMDFQERILDWRGGPVKIYRPGDRGFATREKQCTHISKIKNVAHKTNFTIPMEILQKG